jgi:uncharacterized membrane protein YcgQ (UPF0703/DUF1980 family)
MAERKKYPYDEKAKARIMRYQKKAYSPLNLNLKKGLKEKYKAFASSRGMSITEMITRYLDSEIEAAGFVYQPETDESADE